ncbi:MAG: sodium:solute symporter family protein [Planctomycetota bacterium]
MTPLIIISCYLGLLLGLGLFASRLARGTGSDYLVASHSIGPFLLLMSLFGTTMTAFALVGSTGEAFKEGIGVYGMLASSSGILHSLCFFVLGVRLWTLGQRYGYRTQIQYFRDRLDSSSIGLVLFPVLVGLVVPYLLIGVISSGSVIQAMTAGAFPELFPSDNRAIAGGLPSPIGSLVICLVVLCYVFFGGMRGTAWANAFQTLVFMVLGLVTFNVIAFRLGGEETLWENLRVLGEALPEEKATRSDMSFSKFTTYLLVPLSVGMFPHLFQHWLTAKSAASFKLPVVCHPVFIMIVWVPCVLIGVWATTDLVPATPPLPANPNTILPFLVKTLAGPVLGGFLAAGILAAIMSSLDSQFLCLGTMFTTDIVNHYAPKPELDQQARDRRDIRLARGFIIGIVAVTYLLGLLKPPSVFALGVWCFSGFASLFPLVFASLYWRGLTKAGAYACVLAAISAWTYFFVDAASGGVKAIRTYTVDVPLGGQTYETMPVLWIFLASATALIVVSLVTPKPKAETLAKFFPE